MTDADLDAIRVRVARIGRRCDPEDVGWMHRRLVDLLEEIERWRPRQRRMVDVVGLNTDRKAASW